MKKTIIIAVVFMINATAFGQAKFGVKVGGNMIRLSGLNMYGDSYGVFGRSSFSQGYHIGGYANHSFNDVLGVQVEAVFSMQGGTGTTGFNSSQQLQLLHYINIPLLIDIKPFERPFSFLIGPQFGFCVNRSFVNKEFYGNDLGYKNFDAAIALGSQYTFFNHLTVGLRYNIGLIPSQQFDYEYFYKPNNSETFQKIASLRKTNNMIQLSLGWTF